MPQTERTVTKLYSADLSQLVNQQSSQTRNLGTAFRESFARIMKTEQKRSNSLGIQ